MIEGEKITLSKPTREHMAKLLEWRNNAENRIYYREYRESNIDDQFLWYENTVLKDPTWQHFVVKPKGKDNIIGVAFLNHIHSIYKTAEFGLTLGDYEYRGKGYGKDTLKTLIKYGFEELNLNKIWCEVYSNNDSIHLYRNVGFKDEGVLRQQVFKNGEYLDSHLLGLLKFEYNQKYKN